MSVRPTKPLPVTQTNALETGDIILTEREFKKLDQHVLRRLAANAESDEINGMSTKMELRSYFVRQYQLTEYEQR